MITSLGFEVMVPMTFKHKSYTPSRGVGAAIVCVFADMDLDVAFSLYMKAFMLTGEVMIIQR